MHIRLRGSGSFLECCSAGSGLRQPQIFTRPLPAKELPDAELVLDGFEPGRDYTLTAETVGYKSGDPYHAYLDGNFTELPTREETAELIEKSKPKKTTFTVTADQNGTLHFTLPQKENQVDLVVVAL